MSLPLSLLFGDWTVFLDNTGAPLADGTLTFYAAGTTTPQAVYADSTGNTSLGSVVTLNSAGRPSSAGAPTGVYLAPNGYKLVIADSDAATLVTQDNIEDVGQVWLATLATTWTAGAKSQTSYTATDDDTFITMDGGTLTLQAASARTTPLFVQSVGSSPVAITPNGADTINGVSGAYTLAAASSPAFPTMLLLSDGISTYYTLVGA